MKRIVSLFLAWIMVAQAAAAAPPFSKEMQKALNELTGAKGYTYTSNEAIDVILDEYLSSRPTTITPRKALNDLIRDALEPKINTTKNATLCVAIDDNNKEWWSGTVNGQSIRQLAKDNGLVLGFSVGGYYITREDTTTNNLSVSNLINMVKHDGAEVGSGGWYEGGALGVLGGWWHGNSGKLATGNYTAAQLDSAMDLHFSGNRRCIEDTLGLTMAPWHSHSNSSGSDITVPYMEAAGIRYGISSITSPTSSWSRPNVYYPAQIAHWGTWGTGGTKSVAVSAYPGVHSSRWEIAQTMTETQNLDQVQTTIRRAEQYGGLVVYNLHRASTHNTTLGGGDGWKTMLEWLKGEVDAGRLQIVTPSEAFRRYYDNIWSDTVPFGTGDFADLDGDGHLDFWFSGNGTAAAADTAFLNPYSSAALFKYAGEPTMRLNWSTTGTAVWPGGTVYTQTPDSTWERGNAVKAVIPPSGSGWTAVAEFRAICDTTVASGRNPNNKYIGGAFFAPSEGNSYQYSVAGAPDPHYIANVQAHPSVSTSIGRFNTLNRPGTQYTFSDRNNAHRAGKEWLFVEVAYDVPETADYLFFSVFKHIALPSNQVIITDPKIRFYNRNWAQIGSLWP